MVVPDKLAIDDFTLVDVPLEDLITTFVNFNPLIAGNCILDAV